ncbi:MAG: radical SAM protein [Deltaproteobacteria bacterium]|nr:radical SAM protein [Deltaproteobacteria bacterium]
MQIRQSVPSALSALSLFGVYLRQQRRPFVLNHLPTVRCNLACPFCYVSGPEQKDFNQERFPGGGELTLEESLDLYRQLAARRFRLAVIVGGEPLLWEHLPVVLREVREEIYPTVFTNGLLLSARWERLRDVGTLFVSLDAPDEEHDRLRAHEGLFAAALEGIETVRRRLPGLNLALNMTVTRENLHRVGDMLRLARDLRLPVAFQPPTYDGQFALEERPNAAAKEHTPDFEAVGDAFRLIRDAARSGEAVVGSRAFFGQIIDDRRTYPCHYPAYTLGPVMPDGSVVACTSRAPYASLRTHSVGQILASEGFRENARRGPACAQGCRDWGIYDLSAIGNRRFGLEDARRYLRAFAGRAELRT